MSRISNSTTREIMPLLSPLQSEDGAGSNENSIQPGEGSILGSLSPEILEKIGSYLNIRDQLTFNEVIGGLKTDAGGFVFGDSYIADKRDTLILLQASNSRDKLFKEFAEKKSQITAGSFDLGTYCRLLNQDKAKAENYKVKCEEAKTKNKKIVSEAIEHLKELETLYKKLWQKLENIYQEKPTIAFKLLEFLLKLYANITYAYVEIESMGKEYNCDRTPLISIAKTEIKKIIEDLKLNDDKFKNYFRKGKSYFEERLADEKESLISSNSEKLNSILSKLKSQCPELISELVEQIVYSDPSSGHEYLGVKVNI